MNTIKISVIIPIYNAEKYVEEALDSILKQDIQEIEILCVDDGSKDSSAEIVKQYTKKDPRIKYFYKENEGPGPARNYGLKEAKGEYISFLDSDDYLEPQTLKTAYEKAIELDLDILFFNARVVYETDKLKEEFGYYIDYYKRKENYENLTTGKKLLIKYDLNWDFLPHVGFQIIRRDLVTENDNYFIDAPHEDNLFTIKNLLLAKKVYHMDKEFYVRRLRENSIMTSEMNIKNVHGYFISILKLIEFVKQENYEHETVMSIGNILKRMQSSTIKILHKLKEKVIEKYLKSLSNEEKLLFILLFKTLGFELQENSKLSKQLLLKKRDLKDKEDIILEKKNEIQKKNKVLNDVIQKLKNRKNIIDNKNKEITTKTQKLNELKQELRKQSNITQNHNKRIKEKKNEIKQLRNTIESIENSQSYKIGKIITYIPRKIKNAIKKFS